MTVSLSLTGSARPLPPLNRDAAAWATVHALLAAYARGEAAGGSVDWSDLDAAHALARAAVDSRAACD